MGERSLLSFEVKQGNQHHAGIPESSVDDRCAPYLAVHLPQGARHTRHDVSDRARNDAMFDQLQALQGICVDLDLRKSLPSTRG
ncbi:MAG: hypothetical protein ABWY05_14520 [Noviherbaspirillum sp.]